MIRRLLLAIALVGAAGCGRREPERSTKEVPPAASPAIAADVPTTTHGLIPGVLPTSDVVHGASVFDLDKRFIDQHALPVRLDATRGHVTVLAMFYATCPMACPRLIANIKAAEAELSPDERRGLRVVLVTIDPENDTPPALAQVVSRFQLDDARWSLLTGSDDDIRDLAAVLGIKYREDDGSINHSSVITVLDREGRIEGRFDGLVDTRVPQSRRIRELFAKR